MYIHGTYSPTILMLHILNATLTHTIELWVLQQLLLSTTRSIDRGVRSVSRAPPDIHMPTLEQRFDGEISVLIYIFKRTCRYIIHLIENIVLYLLYYIVRVYI